MWRLTSSSCCCVTLSKVKTLFQVIYPFFHGFVFKFVINNNSSSFLRMSDAKIRYWRNTIIKSFRKRFTWFNYSSVENTIRPTMFAFPETNSCGSLSINPCICLASSYFYDLVAKYLTLALFWFLKFVKCFGITTILSNCYPNRYNKYY